jgi:hypothetical protein
LGQAAYRHCLPPFTVGDRPSRRNDVSLALSQLSIFTFSNTHFDVLKYPYLK